MAAEGERAPARGHAATAGALFIEDGLIGAIAEGAGTMAIELLGEREPLDAIFVPVGNGSLVNGIGTWVKHASPATRVVGVCAESAPSMAISWREHRPVDAPSASIADGIAVRVPVPAAAAMTVATVDEMLVVADEAIVEWMRALHLDAGLVVEPAGAVGAAAIAQRAGQLAGKRVATILTGGNLTADQLRRWLG